MFVAFFLTVKWGRDVLVTLSTLCAILSMALQPLSGALFTVREVWWVQPSASAVPSRVTYRTLTAKITTATTVSSMKRVGLNQATNFLDMTCMRDSYPPRRCSDVSPNPAFQAASSFASADVMYNISSPPFVSGGYTVAEFEVSATHHCPVYDAHAYPLIQLPDVVNGTVYANR